MISPTAPIRPALRSRCQAMSLFVAAACVFVLGTTCLAEGERARPNIVVILADDMGYSDLGCYGGEIETPNLDALAKAGLRFSQFYNTARCWPTRGALLTGYYAQQIRRDTVPGVPKSGGSGTRPAWAPLLPELLKPYGYRAYHSGKWHVDGEPTKNGFDHSYCLQDSDRYFSPASHLEDGVALPPVARDSGYYATTAIADHAVKCLREHAEQFPTQPFFQYVAFIAPHFPLHALQEDIARYREQYRCGWEQIRDQRWRRLRDLGIVQCGLSAVEREVGPPYDFPAALEKLGAGEVNRPLPWSELTDQQRAFQAAKMAVHAAMIDRMDREIGRSWIRSAPWARRRTRWCSSCPTMARVPRSWSGVTATIPQRRRARPLRTCVLAPAGPTAPIRPFVATRRGCMRVEFPHP